MIVLDATNKTLAMKSNDATTITMQAVVSYWAVDAANVWTPRQTEASFSGASWLTGGFGLLLDPPPSGESRVVENIWLHFPVIMATDQTLRVVVGTPMGSLERTIAQITNPSGGVLVDGTTFVMNRQGVWTRQIDVMTGTPAVSNNIF